MNERQGFLGALIEEKWTYLQPAMDPSQTMVPDLRSRMYGRNARFTFRGPNTLVLRVTLIFVRGKQEIE